MKEKNFEKLEHLLHTIKSNEKEKLSLVTHAIPYRFAVDKTEFSVPLWEMI